MGNREYKNHKGGEMKVLKFRAWDSKKEEFIRIFAIIDGSCFVETNPAPVEDMYINVVVDGTSEAFYRDWATYQPVDATLEQFTGLQDKKDKEIFEGDIWEKDGFVGIVQFQSSRWECNLKSKKGIPYPDFNQYAASGEIIGDIHTTPKLLIEDKYKDKYHIFK